MMNERSMQEVGVAQSQQCPTCSRTADDGADFYASCGECKDCKRRRSQQNRALQARKLAAFERFVDVLVTLADKTAEPATESRRTPAKAVA